MPDAPLLDSWVTDLTTLTPGDPPAAARAEGDALLTRWAEPHRRYHTRQHLTEMLAALERLGAAVGFDTHGRSVVRVAAWLHDAVYDVQAPAGDSERASAALARNLLESLGVGSSDVRIVEQLILLTIDHGSAVPDPLADAFTDADLAILAAAPDRFDEYCAQVRAEYQVVPEASYNHARSAILRALVDRPEVYRTGVARAEWTVAARENVRRELARLGRSQGTR